MGILYLAARTYVLDINKIYSAGWRHRNGLMTGPGSGSRTAQRLMGQIRGPLCPPGPAG
ncbi:MAG: hypothetical protein Q7J07_07730 [Pelolinea sp.]|nr:hypothetical protein [Pelolinea sp.]